MDLTLTDDQKLIAETARELLSSRAASAGARSAAAEPGGFSERLWKELVELGWTGLALPESYGGVGEGFLELCLVIEELGRARVPSPLLAMAACCSLPLLSHGTASQKETWLPAITGGSVMTYATGGTVTLDGGVLEGSAPFVPYAGSAEHLLVTTRSGAAAIIDTADGGVTRERLDVVGDPLWRVRFDRVAVPADRVLGDGAAEAVTAYGTAATCAEMVGGAQGVLDRTVDYAREREQFGQAIGAFQAVQHHCANMAIDVLTSRFIAYEAIWKLASGADATTELSLAKSWVSDAYQRVCALGHQVHGAIGFTAEHDLHYYTRHATAAALAFGDAGVHTEKVAASLGI